ncbi:MAG TPA: sulfite exporter TauE/SafE family protein [Burkholderiales bacterium]
MPWEPELHQLAALLQAGDLPRWLTVSTIILLAATVSSTVGFAFSAIAGAMILHYVPNGVEAVQTMMSASIGIQAYSVAGLWRSIQWSRCLPFILGGVGALPLGIVLLLHLQPRAYAIAIGAALVAYGLYMLLRRPVVLKGRERRAADVLVGALGGITGPLAALPGTWLTIWCGLRGWDKVTQRAVYQPYILVMQVVGLGALAFVKPQHGALVGAHLAYALPGLAGAVIGLRFFRWMTDTQFQRAIYLALIASGAALAVK